jgi:hypothetical protein
MAQDRVKEKSTDRSKTKIAQKSDTEKEIIPIGYEKFRVLERAD